MTGPDERARFVDGLRVLASALEQHPEIPLPVNGTDEPFRWNFFGAGGSDPRDAMADAVRALPCAWSKEFSEADPDGRWPAFFDLHGQLGGIKIKMTALRDVVCRKVVTGTREVTEEVPDPVALKKVPRKQVTRTVEDVEWDCGSLLSPVSGRRARALPAAEARS